MQPVVLPDKPGHEGTLRFLVERLGIGHLFDPAVTQHGDAVRHDHGLLLVVGDVHDRDAQCLVDAADLVLHLLTKPAVQRAEGFVHEDQFRIEYQGTGDGHALLLPAGKLAGTPVLESFQLHQLQGPFHPFAALAAVHAADLERKCEIGPHRHVGEEGVVLEHHADAAPAGRQVVDGAAAHEDLARGGRLEAGQHHEAGGLARTGRTQEGEKLSLADVQVDAVYYRGLSVIAFADFAVFDIGPA